MYSVLAIMGSNARFSVKYFIHGYRIIGSRRGVNMNLPDMILYNGKITTLDPSQPEVSAIAIT